MGAVLRAGSAFLPLPGSERPPSTQEEVLREDCDRSAKGLADRDDIGVPIGFGACSVFLGASLQPRVPEEILRRGLGLLALALGHPIRAARARLDTKIAEVSTHLVPAGDLPPDPGHEKGPVSGAFSYSGGGF